MLGDLFVWWVFDDLCSAVWVCCLGLLFVGRVWLVVYLWVFACLWLLGWLCALWFDGSVVMFGCLIALGFAYF